MWNLKKGKKTNKIEQTYRYEEQIKWLPKGKEVGGQAKWVKGAICTMVDGNCICNGYHFVVYTDVEL